MAIPPRIKTFFFKLHSAALPMKTWIVAEGSFSFLGEVIVYCVSAPGETVDHEFVDCWDVLKRTLKKDKNSHITRNSTIRSP